MSGEVTTKKRKNKGKKKDEPADDVAHLIEDGEESSGSGCCAKLLFLILISAFGVAVGVVFFELGGANGPLSELPSLPKLPDLPDLPELPSLSSLPSFSDLEKMIEDIKAPWFGSEPPAPEPVVEQPQEQETKDDDFIEPTPIETDTEPVVGEEQTSEEPVVEEPVVHEAAQIVQSPPEEILEVTTEAPEATTEPTLLEEAETVSEAPIVVEEPQQAAVEEASEVPVEVTEAPVETDPVEAPVETSPVEDAVETPVETTPLEVEAPVVTAPVEEAVDVAVEVIPVVEEEVAEAPVVAPIEEVTEAPTETAPVEEAPVESIPEEVAETPVEVAPVEEVMEAPVEAAPIEEEVVIEEPAVAPVEEVTEAPVEAASVVEEVIETPVEAVPVAEEVAEIPVEVAPVEEVTEAPAEAASVVEEVIETPVEAVPVAEEVAEVPVEVIPEATTAAPVEEVAPAVEETPSESHFETELEDDDAGMPQESYTMRAEREAVQEAIDNVWVLTVRCIEELRALQTVAKTGQTLQSVDEISSRLQPLRSELDDLVTRTSDYQFDGALERAADLDRRLRGVLDALDEARTLDDLLVAEIQRKQDELAAQQDAVEPEPAQESAEEIVAEEPQVQDAPVDVPPVETAEGDVTPQTVDEPAAPVDQVPAEPTITVEVVEQPVEQLVESQASADEISEEPAAQVVDVIQEQLVNEEPVAVNQDEPAVAQEKPVLAEDAAQPDSVPVVEDVAPETVEAVQAEPVPVEPVTAQEPVLEAAPVVEPIVEQLVEEQVPESAGQPEPATEQPTESPQAPEEPQESQPVEEPVQVAKEAFLVEPAEEVAAPAAIENQPAVNNLEETDRLVDQSPGEALKMMEQILEQVPANPLALYGRARSLDTLAELERSNARLEQAIFAYRAVLDLEDSVNDDLYRRAASRCIDRMRFRGFHGKAIRIQQRMVARFPDQVGLQNQLAVSFLITNQPEAAKTILEGVLQKWPESGFAQVHLGFILKTTYDDYEAGARWMRSGIDTRDDGVIDGRFFFHLGDALIRLGRREEAQQVFVEGEMAGVFLSRDQRSLYNVDRLTGKPWWDKESTTYGPFFNLVEANWQSIRDEGVALLDANPPEGFADESEKLKNTGDWKQFELFVQGRKNAANCKKAPKTCALIENYPPALCRRGQVKFSVMHPGTHVWPHTGPTNCRIRAHLGLVVPEGPALRVANETRTWQEGKFIIFDDSFEHEVWHTGSSYRLVLIVDLWHPELTPEERKSLPAI